jgi:hypothetical protein
MSKVFKDYCRVVLFYFLESSGSTFKCGDGLEELLRAYTDFLKCFFGSAKVLEVVTSKNLYGILFLAIRDEELSVIIGSLGMAFVRNLNNIGTFLFADHQGHRILFTIDEDATFRCLISKTIELLHIFFFRRKNISMIPGDTTNDTDVMLIA